MAPKTVDQLPNISGEQLLKLQKGNDVWAMVILSPVSNTEAHQEHYMLNGIPDLIQEVLLEFDDLFRTPQELPPNRPFDHAISRVPDVMPINCCPYKYSPQQKEKIETQVSKMLQSRLVVPSLRLLLPLSCWLKIRMTLGDFGWIIENSMPPPSKKFPYAHY
jgi:hypothetical protein